MHAILLGAEFFHQLPCESSRVDVSGLMDKSFGTQGLYLGTELQQITEALCDPKFHRGLMLQTD